MHADEPGHSHLSRLLPIIVKIIYTYVKVQVHLDLGLGSASGVEIGAAAGVFGAPVQDGAVRGVSLAGVGVLVLYGNHPRMGSAALPFLSHLHVVLDHGARRLCCNQN
jgi:hypothetical protein